MEDTMKIRMMNDEMWYPYFRKPPAKPELRVKLHVDIPALLERVALSTHKKLANTSCSQEPSLHYRVAPT